MGYRLKELPVTFELFAGAWRILMVCPTGFEPVTYGLEGRCYFPTELRTYLASIITQNPIPVLSLWAISKKANHERLL